MKPGEIVYQGKTNKANEIVIRYPEKSDAPEMLRYINTLSLERSFILFQGEQLTIKEEKKYLIGSLRGIAKKNKVVLFVFVHDILIGSSEVTLKEKAEKHVGNFGISIAKDYRGEGIGKLLMKLVLDEAQKNLSGMKIITLGVFSDNDVAFSMYKKFGFVEFGNLPKGIKHKEEFVDHLFMYKEV
jgi:RimJ/RimL family protein N-acetyltransferase